MFPPSFLHALIVAALAWTGLGTITLLALLIRDWLKGHLW